MSSDYIERLKQIPIVQILHELYGIQATQKNGRSYCKIREERTASCCIYPNNSWYDFGGSVGGDSIKLVEVLDGCDRKTAMEKLARSFGIQREHQKRNPKELFDFEWKKLGIYPDMASKNMNINLVMSTDKPDRTADINLCLDSPAQLLEFRHRYQIPINEFRKTDPVGYHNLLKKHVLTALFNEREDYLIDLLFSYRLVHSFETEMFAFDFATSSPARCTKAEQINDKCVLLRRAVDDVSLLKVPLFRLNPTQDLRGILNGNLQIKYSKTSYFELCHLANQSYQNISSVAISFEDYLQAAYGDGMKNSINVAHAAYYQAGQCYLCFLECDAPKIQNIFGEKAAKVTLHFDGFSHKLTTKSRDNGGKKPLSFPEI